LTEIDRFSAIFEQSPLSIQIFSPDGKTIRVNKAWEKLWGVRAEQILGYNILEDRQLVERGIMPFIESAFAGESVHIPPIFYDPEETIPDLSKNKEPQKWTKAVMYPLKDADGTIREIVLIHEDITELKKIEQETRHLTAQIETQRKYLQDLVSNVPGVVWEAWGEPDEKSQRINFVSDYVEKMLGYSVEEWLSTPNFWLTIVYDEDKEKAASESLAIFKSGAQGINRFRWVAKDGRVLWVEAQTTVICDEQGNPVGMRGVTMDITGRKQKEQAERFLFEAGTALSSSLDYETTLATVAHLAVPHFADWCAVDMLGGDGLAHRLAVAHIDPEKIVWAEEIYQKYPPDPNLPHGLYNVIRTGESEFYPEISDELLVEGAVDEEHLRLMREIGFRSAMLVPLKVRDKVLGVITFVNTDLRHHTEADLQLAKDLAGRAALAVDNARLFRAEQLTREAAEKTSDFLRRLQSISISLSQTLIPKEAATVVIEQGINSLGASAGVVVLVTERKDELEIAAALGYPAEIIEKWRHFDLNQNLPINNSIREKMPVFIESFEKYKELYPHLASSQSYTGNQALTSVPLIIEGKTLGALGFSFASSRNFSEDDRAFLYSLAQQCVQALERTRLYENEQNLRSEAETASRIKDEFLATVSHELRTPLNAIVGWSSMLAGNQLDPKAAVKAVETIERNAKSQSQIIEDLLDVSRIITGKIHLENSVVDIASIVSAAIDSVRPAMQAKGISITTGIEPGDAHILGDTERLKQILWNLLSNAAKFTPKGGTVGVRLERIESSAQITVTDSGQGIEPEFLPFVFDRFRQADGTTTRKHSGLGLGLSIVRYLVEMHGGSVRAESEGAGKGAVFILRFPIASVKKNANEENAAPDADGKDGNLLKGLRILVVDDEKDSLALLKAITENAGALVKAVSSSAEAVEAAADFKPDVLISDIGMPVEDGYTLIKKIRQMTEPEIAAVPAIALTAYARQEDRERALSSGFQMHIAKPVGYMELIEAIKKVTGLDR
jgi:PAS domain S-box-containing protein